MKHFRIAIFGIIAVVAIFIAVKSQFKDEMKSDISSDPVSADARADFDRLPVKGMVTMIDLGATECVPCKMMAPILTKLEKAYEGKAVIAFIDVWIHRDQAPRFGIRAIPTQVFFNKHGVEVYRHVGFMDEKSIVEQLSKMGVEKPEI